MRQYCAAYGCSNGRGKESCKGKTFFRFPVKNKKLLKAWVTKLRRVNFVPSEHSILCSDHFEESCFVYQRFTGRRQLKSNSEPTKFCFVKEKSERRKIQRVPCTTPAVGSNADAEISSQQETSESSIATGPESSSGILEQNCPVTGTSRAVQTDCSFVTLIDELNLAKEENEFLKRELEKKCFRPSSIQTDQQMRALTNFSKQDFLSMYNFFNIEREFPTSSKLSGLDQFFLFMVKLRTGITNEFLSVLFGISDSTVSRTFNFVVDMLYVKLKSIDMWPTKEHVREYMPKVFLDSFPQCRAIIDCTEFVIQKPFNPKVQQLTFSHYKNSNTVKGLVAIAPSGAILYVSDLYCGSISDRDMLKRSGFLSKLENGDMVMADRGFPLLSELNGRGITLVMPNFLKNKIQFSIEQRKENCKISHVRVHVERAFSRVKVFKYFEGPLYHTTLHNVNEVFFVAAVLTNFAKPLITVNPVGSEDL